MDVVKFIEERNRMCASHEGNCVFCPANGDICLVSLQSQLCADEQVNLVEEWSAAHPRKTRQRVFFEAVAGGIYSRRWVFGYVSA